MTGRGAWAVGAALLAAAGCGGELGETAPVPWDARVPPPEDAGAPDGGAAGTVLELGAHPLPVAGSAPLGFDVPEGTLSFTVVARGPFDDDRRRLVILELTSPDGTRLVDWDDPAEDLNPASIPYPGVTAVLVPATDDPRARPAAGRWTVRVGLLETDFVDFTPVEGRVDAVQVVFEPEGEEGGRLDLNLFLAPALGLDAATAAEDPFAVDLLARLAGHLEGVASIGDVRFANLRPEHDRIEDGLAVRTLVSTFARPGPRGASVNVFVVEDLAFAAGFTGGVPSPPGAFDTAASGIVIERIGNGGRTGTLLAHELGHFLGLRHTTELGVDPDTGGYRVVGADPVSDTPSCPGGTAVQSCPDYRNLMFPIFPLDGLSLSPAQVAILRGSPVLYE